MLLFFYLLTLAATAPTLNTLFKISSRTHPPSLVSSLLLSKYREVGTQSGQSLSKAQALAYSDVCAEKTCFRYVLESARVVELTHPASECRLNRDDYYQTVVTPLSQIDASLNGGKTEVEEELSEKLKLYLSTVRSEIVFSDFTDLDYDLQCYGDHYELTQVVLEQTSVIASLKLHVNVPSECSFSHFDSRLGDDYTSLVDIELPVNGSFVCSKGRSPHCSMRNAVTTLPKYRSPPF